MTKLIAGILAFFTLFFALIAKPFRREEKPVPTTAVVTTVTQPTTTDPATTTAPTTAPATTQPEAQIPAFQITVKGPGVTRTFTNQDAARLEIVTLPMTYTNSYGRTTNVTVTGVRLVDLLAACGLTPGSASLEVTARDGYAMTYSNDLVTSSQTLLAWEGVFSDGADMPANEFPRLCPGSSNESNLYVKGVGTIELKG